MGGDREEDTFLHDLDAIGKAVDELCDKLPQRPPRSSTIGSTPSLHSPLLSNASTERLHSTHFPFPTPSTGAAAGEADVYAENAALKRRCHQREGEIIMLKEMKLSWLEREEEIRASEATREAELQSLKSSYQRLEEGKMKIEEELEEESRVRAGLEASVRELQVILAEQQSSLGTIQHEQALKNQLAKQKAADSDAALTIQRQRNAELEYKIRALNQRLERDATSAEQEKLGSRKHQAALDEAERQAAEQQRACADLAGKLRECQRECEELRSESTRLVESSNRRLESKDEEVLQLQEQVKWLQRHPSPPSDSEKQELRDLREQVTTYKQRLQSEAQTVTILEERVTELQAAAEQSLSDRLGARKSLEELFEARIAQEEKARALAEEQLALARKELIEAAQLQEQLQKQLKSQLARTAPQERVTAGDQLRLLLEEGSDQNEAWERTIELESRAKEAESMLKAQVKQAEAGCEAAEGRLRLLEVQLLQMQEQCSEAQRKQAKEARQREAAELAATKAEATLWEAQRGTERGKEVERELERVSGELARIRESAAGEERQGHERVKELEMKLRKAQEEAAEKGREMLELQREREKQAEMADRVREMKEQVSSGEEKLKQALKTADKLRSDAASNEESHQAQLDAQIARCSMLAHELEDFKAKYSRSVRDIVNLQEEIRARDDDIQRLGRALEAMAESGADAEGAWRHECAELQGHVTALHRTKHDQEAFVAEAARQIRALTEALVAASATASEHAELSPLRHREVEMARASDLNQVPSLSSAVRGLGKGVSQAAQVYQNSCTLTESLREDIRELTGRVLVLESAAAEAAAREKDAAQSAAQLQRDAEALGRLNEEAVAERAALEGRAERLEAEVKDARELLCEKEAQVQQSIKVQMRLEEAEEQRETAQRRLHRAEQCLEEVEGEKAAVQRRLEMMEARTEGDRQRAQSSEALLVQARKVEADLRMQVGELEREAARRRAAEVEARAVMAEEREAERRGQEKRERELKTAMGNMQRLQAQLTEEHKRGLLLEEQNQSRKGELAAKAEVQRLESELLEERKTCLRLEKEKLSLQESLAPKAEIQRLESELLEERKTCLRLGKEKQSLQEEVGQCHVAGQRDSQLRRRVQEMQEELLKAVEALAASQSALVKLKADSNRKGKEASKYKRETRQLRDTVKGLEGQLHTLCDQIEHQTELCAQATEDCPFPSHARLAAHLSEMKAECEVLRGKVASLEGELAATRKQVEHYSEQEVVREEGCPPSHATLLNQLAEARKETDRLWQRQGEATSVFQSAVGQLRADCTSLRAAAAADAGASAVHEAAVTALQQEVSSLKEALGLAEAAASASAACLQGECSELRESLTRAENTAKEAAALREECTGLKLALGRAEAGALEGVRLREQCEELKADCEGLKEALAVAEKSRFEAEGKLTRECMELKEEVVRGQQEVKEVAVLHAQQAKAEESMRKCMELKAELGVLEESERTARDEMVSLREDARAAREELSSSAKLCHDTEMRLREALQEVQVSDAKRKHVEEECEALREEREQLRRMCESLQEECVRGSEELSAAQTEAEAMRLQGLEGSEMGALVFEKEQQVGALQKRLESAELRVSGCEQQLSATQLKAAAAEDALAVSEKARAEAMSRLVILQRRSEQVVNEQVDVLSSDAHKLELVEAGVHASGDGLTEVGMTEVTQADTTGADAQERKRLSHLQDEAAELSIRLEEAGAERDQLLQSLAACQAGCTELRGQIIRLQQEHQSAQGQWDRLLTQSKDEVELHKSRASVVSAQLTSCKKQVLELRTANAAAERLNLALKSKVDTLLGEREALRGWEEPPRQQQRPLKPGSNARNGSAVTKDCKHQEPRVPKQKREPTQELRAGGGSHASRCNRVDHSYHSNHSNHSNHSSRTLASWKASFRRVHCELDSLIL